MILQSNVVREIGHDKNDQFFSLAFLIDGRSEDQHLWGGAAWPSGFASSQGTLS
jgi:hypothetical protein